MTTYVFMAPGGTDAESSPNGLLMSMVELLDACLKGIAEPTVPRSAPVAHTDGVPGQIENSNYFAMPLQQAVFQSVLAQEPAAIASMPDAEHFLSAIVFEPTFKDRWPASANCPIMCPYERGNSTKETAC
jgi:hypothetical protein